MAEADKAVEDIASEDEKAGEEAADMGSASDASTQKSE